MLHTFDLQLTSGDFFKEAIYYKRLQILNFIKTFGTIGNNIFILISGYFMSSRGKNIKLSKIATKLLSELAFVIAIMMMLSTILSMTILRNRYMYFVKLTSFNEDMWFVGYYFVVIVIAYLFLNEYLAKLDRKYYSTMLIVMFALLQFNFTRETLNNLGGNLSTIFLGCFLYSLGGYIHKYDPFENVKTSGVIVLILLVYIFVFISGFNTFMEAIYDYRFLDTEFTQALIAYGTNEYLVPIVIATLLFEAFKRIRIPTLKIVNFLGQATFTAYLAHDNVLAQGAWGHFEWMKLLHNNVGTFIIGTIICVFVTFLWGVGVHCLYLIFMKNINCIKKIFICQK